MNRVGPILCPILVGRDDLLELAARRLEETAAGRGHLLLLAGEAGIGKTRLLQSMLEKAAVARFRVARADLAPQDRQVPLASILDLARTTRRSPEFGTLGTDLLELRGGKGGDTLGSRRLLVRDTAERIITAIDRPTVLAFEDLQWADELSLEVIGEVARLGGALPLFIIGAYRLGEFPVGSIHREWRARLLSQRIAEEARLAPLTADETAIATSLILGSEQRAPREVVKAVYDRTDGIPLHIEELLGALGEDARRDGRAIRDAEVPDTIEDAILVRVEALSDEARAVARAGAVLGRRFVPEVLAGIMDRPVADLEGPLRELSDNSFIIRSAETGHYDFRHQLLRDVLYQSVQPADLRRLHARAGEFGAQLEGATDVHASVHFERAGLRAQAYRAAVAGAREAAAVSSRQESFELYGRAVANIPEALPALDRAMLYAAYCEAASAVDNVAVMDETAELSRRYYLEAGRELEAADALTMRAIIARRDVRPTAERRHLLEQADAELSALPESPERSYALSDVRFMQATAALDTVRLDDATALIEDARRLRSMSTNPEMGDLDFLAAQVDVLAGRVDVGLAAMLNVARLGRDAKLESTGVTAYRVEAALAARVMDYPAAEIGLVEGLRYTDEIEQSYCRHVLAATSAHVAWTRGRWDEAIPIAEIEMVERGSRRGTLGSRDALGYVAFGRGDVDRARTILETSLAIGMESDEVELILPPLWGLAETALVAGDPATAIDHCQVALDVAQSTGERPLLVPFVVTGVRAHLAARRPEAAERWLAAVAAHLDGWGPLAGPALNHGEGLMRLSAGNSGMARQALEEAVRGWVERGRTWETAWARLDLASCLVRSNLYHEASVLISAARDWAQEVGSVPLLDRCAELTTIGRGRGARSEPWAPLTAREFEVARLIAAGMTNAEIAAELTISPKTASAHVEHMLAKLGATRRAEIAAWTATVDADTGLKITSPGERPSARPPAATGASRETWPYPR